MNVDIRKTCAHCGQHYWWTVQEQEDFAQRGLPRPKRCPACRAARNRATVQQAHALVRREPPPTAMAFPELQQPLITDDIRQLIGEASAPVVDRGRTFSEWWNDVDVREQQLVKKIQAGRTANILVKQRVEIMKSVNEMAQMAANLRRQKLEAELAELELEDRITERVALRDVRLQTQRALEETRRRKLLQSHESSASTRGRIINDHRADLRAKAWAHERAVKDLYSLLDEAMHSNAPDYLKAARIRGILGVYLQHHEIVVPPEVQQLLARVDEDPDAPPASRSH